MYSIKNTQDIKFNYKNASIRKISEHQYQYHGKPNEPNLVLMNGIKRISYIAETIEVKPGNPNELIINHIATSNFPKKAIVKIPLVIKENSQSAIDRLLDMKTNDIVDLDISKDITDYTMEINEADKNAYIIRFTNALPISKKIASKKPGRKIIEGLCGLSEKQITDLETAVQHANNNGKHTHTNEDLTTWLESPAAQTAISDAVAAAAAADDDGSTEIINRLSNGTGEMECFPNEGKVFNKKFYIHYDSNNNQEFIEESSTIFNPNSTSDKYIPHKNAINEAVNELREDIKRLGGIYTDEAINGSKLPIEHSVDDAIGGSNNGKDFFDENTDIDILITYKFNNSNNNSDKLRKLDEDGKPEGAVTEVRQVRDAIFVSYKNGTEDPITMNSVKFARDYLSKDYSRYTHISINGYLTGTQNQAVYFTMMLITTILGTAFFYNVIPSFYKTAIRKITNDDRTCGTNYNNYLMVTGFNYWFMLVFILIPSILLLSSIQNVFTMIAPGIGILIVLMIYARNKFDNSYYYTFYPKDGLRSCNKTIEYTSRGYGYYDILKHGLIAWKSVFT